MAHPRPTLDIEHELWADGARWVAGVDEVGVGPLAGPVGAAAVLLEACDDHCWLTEVDDSKVVLEPRREELAAAIRESAPWGVGWATVDEIDRIGILPARRLAMLRAIEALPRRPCAVVSDAVRLPLPRLRAVIDADALCATVAAASIVAKVARDALMVEMCERFPGYAFCSNKGYSTPAHRAALERRGPVPVHRRSYAPVTRHWPGW